MGSRSEGPDKNRDAEGMLTREGVAANKAAKQKQKAEAAANSLGGANGTGLQAGDAYAGLSANLNAAGSNQNFNQQLGQNYLDSYNDLTGQKKKSPNQLQQLANMNQQMGYNPTTGMGIMGSLNYNTIGAGADIANLMNNPLVKIAGMATNPAMFAGGQFLKNAYGAYADEDDDTGLLNAFSNTAQDITPFDTSTVTDFLGNLFRQEETAPNFNLQSLDQLRKPTAPEATLGDLQDSYSNYGGDFNAINFGIGSPTTDSTDQINTGGFADTDMFRTGVNLSPTEYNPVATSGAQIGLNNVFGNEIISDTGGALTYGDTMYGQEGYDNIIASGGIPVGVTQDMGSFMDRRQGRNQGGLIPPMSGPMSNGLGNLFKMK